MSNKINKFLILIFDFIIIGIFYSLFININNDLVYIARFKTNFLIVTHFYNSFLFLIIGLIFRMYDDEVIYNLRKIIPSISSGVILYMIILTNTPYLVPKFYFSKSIFIILFTATFLAIMLYRIAFSYFFLHRILKKNLIIVYDKNFLYKINRYKNFLYKNPLFHKINFFHHEDINTFNDTFKSNPNTIVILAIDKRVNYEVFISNYNFLEKVFNKTNILNFADFYINYNESVPLHKTNFDLISALTLNNNNNRLYPFYVRTFDLSISIIGVLITLMLIPSIYVINLIFNKGALFYSQKRVGLNNKEFYLTKFRSMVEDAEKHGAVMSSKNDARVTKFGKILRKTRIDEFPQFFSVLKGDMSLIGPRPERKIFVDQLNEIEPLYKLRHLIKPGITGWAQVKYPYGINLEDSINKLEYDLYYILKRSVFLDVRILIKSISSVLFFKGL